MIWTEEKIRKIGKLMGEGKTRSQIFCQMSDVSLQGLREIMPIIDAYGIDDAVRMQMFKVDDELRGLHQPMEDEPKPKKKKKKEKSKNTIARVAARASELGTSYGLYVASEQYRIDVCEGLYS